MNKKDVGATLAKLSGGALIIEEAASMKKAATESLLKQLNQEGKGLIVLLEDTKANIASYLENILPFQRRLTCGWMWKRWMTRHW